MAYMEAIVLDTNFNIMGFVDSFSSFIWTDRYQEIGDFELVLPMTESLKDEIKADYYIQNALSDRTMIVEKFEIETDDIDGSTLTTSGSSLETILKRRILLSQYTLKGTLEDAIATLLNDCIISPENEKRKINNFYFRKSGDSRIEDIEVDTQYERGDNLYDVVQAMCIDKDVGFKITLDDENNFIFQLYKGLDHTYEQNDRPYIVFAHDLDNLISNNYIEDYTDYKNVTLVDGENDDDGNPKSITVGTIQGLSRREMYTNASGTTSKNDDDTTMTDSEYYELLTKKGNEDLKDNIYNVNCDGEMTSYGEYTYGNDFEIGDLIQVRNEWGYEFNATITEFIMSQSDSGYEVYPTFKVNNDVDDEEEEE
jgi:hypothetical protein